MKRLILLLLPVLLAIVAFAAGGSRETSPSVATFAAPDEPGTRLVVDGGVWDYTGTRGVAGVKLEAYHTDAKGLYNPRGTNGDARLKGTVVTDAEGRFKWLTIRPMPYPGGGNPAHIHIQASGGGYPSQWVDDMHFSDCQYVTARLKEESKAKGKFGGVVTTTRDAKGVLHATLNIRLSENPRN
jgi:protocatechuate 3,4-dioxygenase, beta subunit